MLDRRRLLALLVAPVVLAPAAALAQANEKKKGGGISFVQFPTLTATIIKSNGHRGVLTVDAGVDVPDAGLRARVNLDLPRLRAAYVEVLQAYVYSLSPGYPPDPDYLSMALQRSTDAVLGQHGAHVLLGALLVN
jgi:hypothetical protein